MEGAPAPSDVDNTPDRDVTDGRKGEKNGKKFVNIITRDFTINETFREFFPQTPFAFVGA